MTDKKKKILIVDDDKWIAQHYARICQSINMEVTCVYEANEAIAKIDNIIPDVLVLDLFLPGMNALGLIHEMRSYIDLSSIPIILCTSSLDDAVKNSLKFYGVKQILDKSTMQPNDLVNAIRRALL